MNMMRNIYVVVALVLALVVASSHMCEANRRTLTSARKLQGTDPGINAQDPSYYFVSLKVRCTSPLCPKRHLESS